MTAAVAFESQYLDLIRAFPPRPIHNARQYEATVVVMNRLAIRDEKSLTNAEADYLDALATFVEQYDERHFEESQKKTPLQWLQYLMKESGMSRADLGRLLGNRGLASQILLGRRELSKLNIRRLADHFKVSPELFL